MAKTIKKMAEKAYPFRWACGEPTWADKKRIEAYICGANAVLDMIETYIQNLDLGNSAKEKFYKLDVISDIGLYIKELKGE